MEDREHVGTWAQPGPVRLSWLRPLGWTLLCPQHTHLPEGLSLAKRKSTKKESAVPGLGGLSLKQRRSQGSGRKDLSI